MQAAGKTLLEHLVERLRYAEELDAIHIITSNLEQDNPIAELAESIGVVAFRGSEDDVLDRYYRAALQFEAVDVVRVTADCPIIDPRVVDRAVRLARQKSSSFDLLTNRYPITYPDGLDVDVIPFAALEKAWRDARTPHQREHVIPYFWEEGQRVENFTYDRNCFYTHRWTLDYPEDYSLLKAIIEGLYEEGRAFSLEETLAFVEANPHIAEINRMYLPTR